MKRILGTQPFNTDLGILLLRLILGGLFTWHGYDALNHYKLYLSMSTSTIGLGAPLEFNLVVFSHFLCGLFVAVGFLTRLSVIPLFITMTVAFFIAHKGQPFMTKELPFVYMLSCIPVFVLGSGRFSVDRLLFRKNNQI
ncbi:MAG: DoxX family protein [Chitinophagaceae bacterium]